MEVMNLEWMEQLTAALAAACPDWPLVTRAVEGGLPRPCLQLLIEELSLKREMGNRWRETARLQLNWVPTGAERPEDAARQLSLLVADALPAARVDFKVENGRLCGTVTRSALYFLTPEEAEKMKQQLVTLALKWQGQPAP